MFPVRRALLAAVGRRSLSASTTTPTAVPAATTSATTTLQAPNAPSTWSVNQRPRPAAASGPRFEQTAMELQPNPLSAMALISEVPVNMVNGRKAVCDGGGGPLGHPKIYINLDLEGPRSCGCFPSGLRFQQADQHHH
ncbi:hypothetical protein FB45DRAFT_748035 [Roridomyces roridus]|uniref:Zinc finger CHCC-type domain-containing protein n=1 Tax=Roridomyces roridus TaxID=1738132 RepID=A0AAD7BUL3_9AGAR|nr:hypothetical protein FB45DRAFT_748035 [Roridomyces roridus]